VKGVERLVRAVHIDVHKSASEAVDAQPYRERFIEAMEDDFNTPQSVAALFDLAREINVGHDERLNIVEAQKTLRELAGVLGLTLKEIIPKHLVDHTIQVPSIPPPAEQVPEPVLSSEGIDQKIVEARIKEREELRRARKWKLADEIREELRKLGITLEDTPQGTVWRYKKP
jgi:cysteinyl-tRNA synthetase